MRRWGPAGKSCSEVRTADANVRKGSKQELALLSYPFALNTVIQSRATGARKCWRRSERGTCSSAMEIVYGQGLDRKAPSGKYPKLTGWVEESIDETLTFYRLPRQHHKHLKSTNMLEHLNEEIKRRTHVVRIFPNARAACGWCGRSPSKPTRTGSSSIAISTWTICASTKRRRCAVPPDPRPVQPSPTGQARGLTTHVLARSRTLRAGSADAAACAAASLTAAARGALPDGRPGRRDGRIPIEQRDVLLT